MKFDLLGTAAAALLCCVMPVAYAQEQGQQQAEVTYDPAPFLSSMVTMRTAAVTCNRFVANSPQDRTNSIVEFFGLLNQELPELADRTTQASLNLFVPSQAAVLCREKLDAAYRGYQGQRQIYLDNKPDDWPEPPAVANGPWCSSENCLEF